MTVFQRLLIHVLCSLVVGVFVYRPSYHGEHGIPRAGTESGEGEESAHMHARQSGRDADELSHGRNESSEECGGGSVFAEELLCLFHRLAVYETHVSYSAVGKFVYYRSAEPFGEVIVHKRTDVCTDGCEDDHQYECHVAVRVHRLPCCRRHYYF